MIASKQTAFVNLSCLNKVVNVLNHNEVLFRCQQIRLDFCLKARKRIYRVRAEEKPLANGSGEASGSAVTDAVYF